MSFSAGADLAFSERDPKTLQRFGEVMALVERS